jgi:hypothetical protein
MDIREIRRLASSGQYEVSIHAQQERLEDDLDLTEVEAAILNGQIIEDYPNDPRGPSCLISGKTGNRAIHVVVGWAPRRTQVLRVITVYIPQSPKWSDPQTRGEKK